MPGRSTGFCAKREDSNRPARNRKAAQDIKVFLLLFLQKKKSLLSLSGSDPAPHRPALRRVIRPGK
jgi:hypothetical protein